MGRGGRTDTGAVTLRAADAGDRRIGEWAELALPGRGELREADASAPRDHHASSAAAMHPDWNEDRALCDQQRAVALVVDGMGGYDGGERASQAAIGAAALNLPALPPRADRDGRRRWLEDTLLFAQAVVREDKLLHPHFSKQDATAAAAVLADSPDGPVVLCASAGDSRVYRADSAGELHTLTRDDDLLGARDDAMTRAVRELLDTATTSEELDANPLAAKLFDRRNTISASLAETDPSVVEHAVADGDLVVITSDGVHDNLARQEIAEIVTRHRADGPAAVCEALRAAARARADEGLHVRAKDDDITCVALTVEA